MIKVGQSVLCDAVYKNENGETVSRGTITCTPLSFGDGGREVYVKCSDPRFHDPGKGYRTLRAGALETCKPKPKGA